MESQNTFQTCSYCIIPAVLTLKCGRGNYQSNHEHEEGLYELSWPPAPSGLDCCKVEPLSSRHWNDSSSLSLAIRSESWQTTGSICFSLLPRDISRPSWGIFLMLLNWHGFFISIFYTAQLGYPWSLTPSKIIILSASTISCALLHSAMTLYSQLYSNFYHPILCWVSMKSENTGF